MLQKPNFIKDVLTDIQSFPQCSKLHCVGVSSSKDCSAWGNACSRLVEIWVGEKKEIKKHRNYRADSVAD